MIKVVKMPVAKCGCCWERPAWFDRHRHWHQQIGRYLIVFTQSKGDSE